MVTDARPASQERVRGASLGLPVEGPGSLAAVGTQVGALPVDSDGCGLHDRISGSAVVRG
jgi:hypothetical protein